MSSKLTDEKKLSWVSRKLQSLEEGNTANRLFYALVAICAALFIAEPFYKKKSYLEADGYFGFYAIFSLVVCILIVFAAQWLRNIAMRDEDYYGSDSTDGEDWPEAELARERENADV